MTEELDDLPNELQKVHDLLPFGLTSEECDFCMDVVRGYQKYPTITPITKAFFVVEERNEVAGLIKKAACCGMSAAFLVDHTPEQTAKVRMEPPVGVSFHAYLAGCFNAKYPGLRNMWFNGFVCGWDAMAPINNETHRRGSEIGKALATVVGAVERADVEDD